MGTVDHRPSHRTVIDLTRVLAPGFPTSIPDAQPVTSWEAATYLSHGYRARAWSMVEHIGTHVDAPVHFIEGGRTVPELTPEELVLPGRVIDFVASARSNPSAVVAVSDLERHESLHGRIVTGSAVLLCSGHSRASADASSYLGWDGSTYLSPGWSAEAVEWLVAERDVRAVGTDTSSVDAGNAEGAPAHRSLLGADRYAIEGLVNLERLIDAQHFVLIVGVLPWADATGAPCRVLAVNARTLDEPT